MFILPKSSIYALCAAVLLTAGCGDREPDVAEPFPGNQAVKSSQSWGPGSQENPVKNNDYAPAKGLQSMTTDPHLLFEAALNGKAYSVKKALDKGINPDVADAELRTPLMLAAYNGHADILKMLLDAGAEVNRKDKEGRTALMFASTGPFPKAVKLLIDCGAEVNAIDGGEGWTPLMFAAAEGHLQVAEILLAAGADKTIIDEDGDTAYSFAAQKRHPDVAKILSE